MPAHPFRFAQALQTGHSGLPQFSFLLAKNRVPRKSFSCSPPIRPTATDLEGDIVWYVPTRDQSLVRMFPADFS